MLFGNLVLIHYASIRLLTNIAELSIALHIGRNVIRYGATLFVHSQTSFHHSGFILQPVSMTEMIPLNSVFGFQYSYLHCIRCVLFFY